MKGGVRQSWVGCLGLHGQDVWDICQQTQRERSSELTVANGYQWIPHHDREVASWIEEYGGTDRQLSDRMAGSKRHYGVVSRHINE